MYLGRFVEWGDAEPIYDDPQHPYTALAAGRRAPAGPEPQGPGQVAAPGRDPRRALAAVGVPVPPALPRRVRAPAAGRARPRRDFFERRWTEVDPEQFERELDATGPLDSVVVSRYEARFSEGDAAALEALLSALRDESAAKRAEGGDPAQPGRSAGQAGSASGLVRSRQRDFARIFTGVEAVEREGPAVVVRFGEGPAPALQRVAGRHVACHLHGIVPRQE